MKLIYSTNMWTHHQMPIATELAKILGPDQFKMAVFEEISDERREMGWGEKANRPWLIGPPSDLSGMQALLKECIDADVMILGACPQKIMKTRIATGKLTLVAAERMLKKPFHHLRMLNPRYAMGIRRYRTLVTYPHVYALAIGHYAPGDLRMIGAFEKRILQWAYFVEQPTTLPKMPPARPLKLLWVGRMLALKRVDLLLKAVDLLRDTGCIGKCLIVGDGPERKRLLKLARRLNLTPNFVQFVPPVAFSKVRYLMREADAYVLSSNRHEGWGAVAGEAMAEGCILVANEAAGAARVLVQDGETGLLFRDGDEEQLAEQLKKLNSDYSLRMRIRKQAWEQMQALWHPRVAAERLVVLCKSLIGRSNLPSYTTGPCSIVTGINNQRK